MATYPPLFARPPLEMHKYFTNMIERSRSTTPKSSHSQNGHGNGKSGSLRDDEGQDDVKLLLKVLERVKRSLPCGWNDCSSNLASLENLKKHLRKRHCQPLSSEAITSSSRPYRCRYDSCQNKSFYDSSALFEHALETHIYPLRLRCPIMRCKYKAQNFGLLVQHLSTVHNTIPEELPRAVIMPISTGKLPTLPSLPDQEIMILTDLAMVKPNPSFNHLKATRNMNNLLEYSALMELDDEDDIPSSPFSRIEIPKNTNDQKVRPTPRLEKFSSVYPSRTLPGLDDLPPLGTGDGPSFGYLVWKRRFEEAENIGKLPFAYNSKKRK